MISKISERLSSKLITDGTISEDDKELYDYGLFMLLSYIVYLCLTCILGLIFQCFFESIVFYIVFQAIRKFAGGYHASTELKCEALTTLSILLCIVVIRLSRTYDFQTVLLIFSSMATICIFCLCPLDTPEKPLSVKEFKYFRKISLTILFVIIIAIIVSYYFKIHFIFLPCCLSIILESVLLISAKFQKALKNKKKAINL